MDGRALDEQALAGPFGPELAALVGPASPRTMQERLERLLLDDQELLISLHCQLDQIRRELRLLNDDRIVRSLAGAADAVARH